NLFNISETNFIIPSVDPTTLAPTYFNGTQTGSRGFEASYKAQYGWGYVGLNYSFYTSVNDEIALLSVPGHSNAAIAFPQHKVALHAHFKIWRSLSLNASGVFMSRRYTYPTAQLEPVPGFSVLIPQPVLGSIDPTTLLNVYLLYKDL